MTGQAIITAIIEMLVSGLGTLGAGIGTALSSIITGLAFTGEGNAQTMSAFAIFVIVFAAISLGFALSKWLISFFTSWGNRNRA